MNNTYWQQYNIFRLAKKKNLDEFTNIYYPEERYGHKALREDHQNKINPNIMTDYFHFSYPTRSKNEDHIQFSYDPSIKFDMTNNLLSDRRSSYRGDLHTILESLTKRDKPETYNILNDKIHIGKDDVQEWKDYLGKLNKYVPHGDIYRLPDRVIAPTENKIFSILANHLLHEAPDSHPKIPKFMLDQLEEHYTGQPLHRYLQVPMSGYEHLYNPIKANDLPNMMKLLLHHYYLNPQQVFIPHVDVPQHVIDAHELAQHYMNSL